MPTQEEYNVLLDILNKNLETINSVKIEDLIRENNLSSNLNFKKGEYIFSGALGLFNELTQVNLGKIPYNIINEINSYATNFLSFIKRIKEFTELQTSPAQSRDDIINQLESQYKDYFKNISPIIAYSIKKGTDFEKLENEARNRVNEINKVKLEIEKQQKESLDSANSTIAKLRVAASEVGVAQHSIHFKKESDEHLKSSRYWLIATIFMALATVSWGIVTFFLQPRSSELSDVVQFAFSKLIILSGLYYALVWCAKNYGAHKHNSIMNKHRQNALNTFETFIKAAENDPDTKNAVLLQTTQSIFSSQSSGFINSENENDSQNKIIEIFRNVSSTVAKK